MRVAPRRTLFPYTTLFRSHKRSDAIARVGGGELHVDAGGKAGVVLDQRADREKPFARLGLAEDHAVRISDGHDGHRSEEHTSELQSLTNLVCRLLLEKKKE